MSDEEKSGFYRNDPGYADWLHAHPEGFVLATGDTLHRVTCPVVAADPSAGTELEDFVLVSESSTRLEYAAFVLGGAFYCERCSPPRDVRGVQMHAEYAANMRAHIAREREAGRLAAPELSDPSDTKNA